MIRLERSMFRLDSVEDVRESVQTAIQLEHATIPPYLYAVFSLTPLPNPVNPPSDPNKPIRDLISSVVAEEMAHMALVCNLLNAIGGAPEINGPDFVPTYPGPLPGGIDSDLQVGIEPFSIDVVKGTFMGIEEPESTAGEDTIGAFYRKLLERLQDAGEGIFSGDPALQVSAASAAPTSPEVIPIASLADAAAAIEVIVEQGEGSSTSPLDEEGEFAHFYRFGEIAEGNMLVPNPGGDPPFTFTGDPLPVTDSAVVRLKSNPKRSDYSALPQVQRACDTFNYTYTTLLNALHVTFNGRPGNMASAVGLMESLWEQALAMAQFVVDAQGTRAGPSFEYQPVNPGA